MSKEIEAIPNNIKSFINKNLTGAQLEQFLNMMMEDYDVSERSLSEDMRGMPVPYWRQQVWAKELSEYTPVKKADLFPGQQESDFKPSKTAKVK